MTVTLPGEHAIRMGKIGRIFLAGLLAALPLLLTIFVTGWLLSLIYQYLGPSSAFGPRDWYPTTNSCFSIAGSFMARAAR